MCNLVFATSLRLAMQANASGTEQRQLETTLTINGNGMITKQYDVWQGENPFIANFGLVKRLAGSIVTFFKN
jgi:hypothetical protein